MIAALPLALICGFSLASAALSLLALARARVPVGAAGRKATGESAQLSITVDAVQKAVEALSEEMRELRRYPATTPDGLPKPGLNLNKRSQALRMHRRGETSEQIASTLAVSRQEVDLLLKVHRIVMNRI